MTDRWRSYFIEKQALGNSWLKAAVSHWQFNEILYGNILHQCPPPASILDVGCGPGWSGLYLAALGYNVFGIDSDEMIVDHAIDLANRLKISANFGIADASNLTKYHNRFDLAYSCGVLEHFDRKVTIELLKEQKKCAPLVLIQIPTRFTAYSDKITDERIYTPRQLRKILIEAGFTIKSSFGYGDLTAIQSQIWLRRILPRGIYRYLQNLGFCYSIAAVGQRRP
jgi:SAM-dependent methyltransferase